MRRSWLSDAARPLCSLKYAVDEDFADCRPGTLLTEVTFREGFSCPEIDEINPMSDSDAHRVWHMARNEYVDVHLTSLRFLRVLLQLPHFLYQEHVRPWIPATVKLAYRKLKEACRNLRRKEDHKPRRAAEAARLRHRR